MKYALSILLVGILPVCFLQSGELALNVSAESALLMNADTGAILYQKKPRLKLYPASITKIATCLYVLKTKGDCLDEEWVADQECVGSVTEEAKQRSKYKLPSHWLVTDSSHIGIKRGEKMKVSDLLNGMMVASGDDASNVLARGVGGTIPEFMTRLNGYLVEIGCKDTNFNNPHGLHHPEHVTTAYDMAVIAKEALKDERFRKIVATVRCARPKTNMQEASTLLQTNKLLRKGELYYPKAIGVKTGWHSKAGNTFVAAAEDGERTLIAVLMNVKERRDLFLEAIKLFDAAFKQPKIQKVLVSKGPQKFEFKPKGSDQVVKTYAEKDFSLAFYPAEEPKIRAYVTWNALQPPIKRGEAVGALIFKDDQEKQIGEIILLAQEDLKKKHSPLLLGGLFLLSCGGLFLLYRLVRKR